MKTHNAKRKAYPTDLSERAWKHIHDTLRGKVRKNMGKKQQPTAGIIDSKLVKTAEKRGFRGYNTGKKLQTRCHSGICGKQKTLLQGEEDTD